MISNFEYFNYYYYRSCIEINKTKSNDTERKKPGEYIKLRLIGREPLSISTLMYVGVVCQRRLVHSSFYYSFGSFSLSLKDDGQEKKGKKQKKKQISGWMDGWMDG